MQWLVGLVVIVVLFEIFLKFLVAPLFFAFLCILICALLYYIFTGLYLTFFNSHHIKLINIKYEIMLFENMPPMIFEKPNFKAGINPIFNVIECIFICLSFFILYKVSKFIPATFYKQFYSIHYYVYGIAFLGIGYYAFSWVHSKLKNHLDSISTKRNANNIIYKYKTEWSSSLLKQLVELRTNAICAAIYAAMRPPEGSAQSACLTYEIPESMVYKFLNDDYLKQFIIALIHDETTKLNQTIKVHRANEIAYQDDIEAYDSNENSSDEDNSRFYLRNSLFLIKNISDDPFIRMKQLQSIL
jgi:hypothetical protein